MPNLGQSSEAVRADARPLTLQSRDLEFPDSQKIARESAGDLAGHFGVFKVDWRCEFGHGNELPKLRDLSITWPMECRECKRIAIEKAFGALGIQG